MFRLGWVLRLDIYLWWLRMGLGNAVSEGLHKRNICIYCSSSPWRLIGMRNSHNQSESDLEPNCSSENIWGCNFEMSYTILLISSCTPCDLWCAEFKSCSPVWNYFNNCSIEKNIQYGINSLFIFLLKTSHDPNENAMSSRQVDSLPHRNVGGKMTK